MILYFSGTGNSRYCAQVLAKALEEECIDTFAVLRGEQEAVFASQRPWVFVTPTYGWQLPRLFADLLRRAQLTGSREAYFVLTCGSEIGNAAAGIEALCREIGLHCQGVQQIIMPENYIALFRAPQPEQARQIVAEAMPALQQAAGWIADGLPFPPPPVGAMDRLKSGPVNRLFYRFAVKAKPFYATDRCNGCGKCVRSCVYGNIRLEAGKPQWGKQCTHCMACICGCPTGAIEYGHKTRKKVRYLCPGLSQEKQS